MGSKHYHRTLPLLVVVAGVVGSDVVGSDDVAAVGEG
jgi:hypothetical protein